MLMCVSRFGGWLYGSVCKNLNYTLQICTLSLCMLYFKKTYPYKTSAPKSNPTSFFSSQIDGQNDLKAIEKEKTVVALEPKEASKCHREDLAKAFYVRTEFVSEAWGCGVFRLRVKRLEVLKMASQS